MGKQSSTDKQGKSSAGRQERKGRGQGGGGAVPRAGGRPRPRAQARRPSAAGAELVATLLDPRRARRLGQAGVAAGEAWGSRPPTAGSWPRGSSTGDQLEPTAGDQLERVDGGELEPTAAQLEPPPHGGGGDAPGHDEGAADRRTAVLGPAPDMGPAPAVPTPNPSFITAGEDGTVDVPVKDLAPALRPLGMRRGKKAPLSTRLRRLLEVDDGRHTAEIAAALVERAKGTGKTANDAVRVILDRVEGPVVRKVETTGEQHVRKTIVVRASEELLRRAGDDAALIDLELPEVPGLPPGEGVSE